MCPKMGRDAHGARVLPRPGTAAWAMVDVTGNGRVHDTTIMFVGRGLMKKCIGPGEPEAGGAACGDGGCGDAGEGGRLGHPRYP